MQTVSQSSADCIMKHVIVMGSSGRLGRMVRKSWALKPDLPFHPLYQYRRQKVSEPDLLWSADEHPEDFVAALKNWLDTPALGSNLLPVMIVLAGITPSSSGQLDENVPITRNCLLAARAAGIGRVLIASSSSVYGSNHSVPIPETAAILPNSDYGRHKQQMEQLCAASDWFDIEICLLRIGNVAGADALMLNHFKDPSAKLHLDIFQDGKSLLRSYIGPITLADVLAKLAMVPGPIPSILNISAPSPIYMDDLAAAAGIEWYPRPATDDVCQSIILDTKRLEALHRFHLCDSSPLTMVQQLRKIGY